MNLGWSRSAIPDVTGKRVVVTGANSGLGYATALRLAERGAHVTLAARSESKATEALAALRAKVPAAQADWRGLDLADLSSVRAFADSWDEPIHLLINNAGVMAIPKQLTADGFEMQLGTNHFGHFALTGLLLQHLLPVHGARVVTVSSFASYIGKMRFEDLDGNRSYSPWPAYGQSKLANLLFTNELDRRLRRAHRGVLAAAAHPGYASTNLQHTSADSRGSTVERAGYFVLNNTIAQNADGGALPTLFAATAPDVHGGGLYGPRVLYGWRGGAGANRPPAAARDEGGAARLWNVSVERTGVDFAALS